jgi:hypothetical protein
MADDLTLEQKDWRERFRAVALAQGRYLYVLLIVALFFAALADANAWNLKDAHGDQELSLIGIKLNARTLLAAGAPVLALVILAALGTFPALAYAHERAAKGLVDDRVFERLDSVPTAIDFVVYSPSRGKETKDSKLPRLGLLAYPACLWLAYIEAAVLVGAGLSAFTALNTTQCLLTVLGGVLLALALPRMLSVTRTKAEAAFGKKEDMSGRRPA